MRKWQVISRAECNLAISECNYTKLHEKAFNHTTLTKKDRQKRGIFVREHYSAKIIIAERSEALDCGSHSHLCMTSATDRPRACVADWSCARVRHPARAYV